MTTATKKSLSAELNDLQRRRDESYAELQQAKRERQDWEDELVSEQAALNAYIDAHPEDWRDDARNPKAGSGSAKKRAAWLNKRDAGNPHEPAYVEARQKYHGDDEARVVFLRRHLPDLIAEEEPAFQAVVDKFREGFVLLTEAGTEYQALLGHAQALVKATPGIDGQAIAYDLRPREWQVMAASALDDPLTRPGLTDLGRWKLSDR